MYKLDNIIYELINKAKKSDVSNKHAAGLIIKNKVIYYGVNRYIRKYNTIHAELNIFERLKKNIKRKGTDIIVIRVDKNGELKNSRPCNHCIHSLRKLGIRKVFYSNEHGYIVCEDLDNMELLHTSAGNKSRAL